MRIDPSQNRFAPHTLQDRFGYGVVLSPRPVVGTLLRGTQLGSRRDFAWGICEFPS